MTTVMNRPEMNCIMLLMREAQDKVGDDLHKSRQLWQLAGRIFALDLGPVMGKEEILRELLSIREDIRKLISSEYYK